MKFHFIIVGGGVAAMSCLNGLIENVRERCVENKNSKIDILLLTATPHVKIVKNVILNGKGIETFDVVTSKIDLDKNCGNTLPFDTSETVRVEVIVGILHKLLYESKEIIIHGKSGNLKLFYDEICLCTGSVPKKWNVDNFDHKTSNIVYIKDFESICKLQQRIKNCNKVMLIGSGAINAILVEKIVSCDIFWVNRYNDEFIAPFLSDITSQYYYRVLESQCSVLKIEKVNNSEIDQQYESFTGKNAFCGNVDYNEGFKFASIGFNWPDNVVFEGKALFKRVYLINDEITGVVFDKKQCSSRVDFHKGAIFMDIIIVAIGVEANCSYISSNLTDQNGIIVDENMYTTVKNVYAAGDVASLSLKWCKNYTQIKLWSTARKMGKIAAFSMLNNFLIQHPLFKRIDVEPFQLLSQFNFELFNHVTQIMGKDLVLLGNFNIKNVPPKECTIMIREGEQNISFTKLVLLNDRVIGAILIGSDVDLAETFENLILNQLNVASLGQDILDPNIDIEDYFD